MGTPKMAAASVRFAHRSRRFTIRTVSHTQNAAKAIPKIDRATTMPGFYLGRGGSGNRSYTGAHVSSCQPDRFALKSPPKRTGYPRDGWPFLFRASNKMI